MKSNRALFHMCASPNTPTGDDFGAKLSSTCATNTASCSSDPHTGATTNIFSPFSPMDAQNQENTPSNTTTPRRKLSLEMDENAHSPIALEQDVGYGGSLGSSSASSLGEGIEANTSRTPLGEIKLSALNTADVSGCQRKTLLARRLMKRENSKENTSGKDSPVAEGFKFCHPLPLLPHRPTSLPTLPLSPLTQQQPSPSTLESSRLMRSIQSGACKNLMKQINSPLERLSLVSSFSGLRSSVTPRRSSSIASSTYTDVCSDGYFSEVFDGEEIEDIDSTAALSDTLTTLINAPLANSPSLSTVSGSSKPTFHIGGFKVDFTGPPPSHAPGFLRSDSWCSPSSFSSSKAIVEEDHSLHKRGALKRASPCNEITTMPRTKRRPPLPFTDISSNSQDSLPTVSTKQLKGTPLLRSQSCCVPHNEAFPSPTSPGADDPNKIGDFTKPYALPLVAGTVPDLKCVSPETISDLLAGRHSNVVGTFTIIDCRFPYEYEGGHILNAVNIWEKDQLIKYFFDDPHHPTDQHRNIYIFHCEFSSKRGPQMSRFLRETDRRKNGMDFPKLYYPELYLIEGGYRAFYKDHKHLCEPQGYREMIDKDHKDELKHCKLRSKSWNGECHLRRRPPHLRCRKSAFISNENKDSNSASNDPVFSRTNSTPYQGGQ